MDGQVIKVVQGTYVLQGKGSAVLNWQGHDLKIEGGYRSAGGERDHDPTKTIIDGLGSVRCLYVRNLSDDSKISGFTIQGGMGETGGGIYNPNSALNIRDCIFRDNDAVRGGAIYSVGVGFPHMTNCLFYDNEASESGGAIYGNTKITHCTFSRNTANDEISSVVGNSIIRNSILWDGSRSMLGNPDVKYSSIPQEGYEGNGNLMTPPLFLDAGNGNFRLMEGSPAIDAGDSVVLVDHDLDGKIRPVGNRVDMGAYEYGSPAGENILQLTSPLEGDIWIIGLESLVQWDGGDSIVDISIELAVDGGETYISLWSDTSYNKYAKITVPGIRTDQAQIRVRDIDNPEVYALSDEFSIQSDAEFKDLTLTITSPVEGEVVKRSPILVEYSVDDADFTTSMSLEYGSNILVVEYRDGYGWMTSDEVSVFFPLPEGEHVWVAPGGDDASDGTQDVPYQSIQYAIDQVYSLGMGNGGTVHVKAGIYAERIVLRPGITLIGEDRFTTIIDAPMGMGLRGIEETVAVWGAEGAVLKNFTIRNYIVGVYMDGVDMEVSTCFFDTKPDETSGRSILLKNSSSVIHHTIFEGGHEDASSIGAGLAIDIRVGAPQIFNNTIRQYQDGGVWIHNDSFPLIQNNIIVANNYGLQFQNKELVAIISDEYYGEIDANNINDNVWDYKIYYRSSTDVEAEITPNAEDFGLLNISKLPFFVGELYVNATDERFDYHLQSPFGYYRQAEAGHVLGAPHYSPGIDTGMFPMKIYEIGELEFDMVGSTRVVTGAKVVVDAIRYVEVGDEVIAMVENAPGMPIEYFYLVSNIDMSDMEITLSNVGDTEKYGPIPLWPGLEGGYILIQPTDFAPEAYYHGNRINMGAYGGTNESAISRLPEP